MNNRINIYKLICKYVRWQHFKQGYDSWIKDWVNNHQSNEYFN